MTEPVMSPRRDDRFKMAPLSEYYEDLLKADAFVARTTLSAHARSLLQSSLGKKEAKILARVDYLAKKRNLSIDEMWAVIHAGKAEQPSKEEGAELQEDEKDAD